MSVEALPAIRGRMRSAALPHSIWRPYLNHSATISHMPIVRLNAEGLSVLSPADWTIQCEKIGISIGWLEGARR